MKYNILLGGWEMICPKVEQVTLIQLFDFRKIMRINEGVREHSAYIVSCHCYECAGIHDTLNTQEVLDVKPVGHINMSDSLPVYYEFMTGKMDIAVNVGYQIDQKLLHGEWPLSLRCFKCKKWRPGWPSLFHEINMVSDKNYLATHTCSACGEQQIFEYKSQELIYPRI